MALTYEVYLTTFHRGSTILYDEEEQLYSGASEARAFKVFESSKARVTVLNETDICAEGQPLTYGLRLNCVGEDAAGEDVYETLEEYYGSLED